MTQSQWCNKINFNLWGLVLFLIRKFFFENQLFESSFVLVLEKFRVWVRRCSLESGPLALCYWAKLSRVFVKQNFFEIKCMVKSFN